MCPGEVESTKAYPDEVTVHSVSEKNAEPVEGE